MGTFALWVGTGDAGWVEAEAHDDADGRLELARSHPLGLDDGWARSLGTILADEVRDADATVMFTPLSDWPLLACGGWLAHTMRAAVLAGYPGWKQSVVLTGRTTPSSARVESVHTKRPLVRMARLSNNFGGFRLPSSALDAARTMRSLYVPAGGDEHLRLRRSVRTAVVALQMDNAYERLPAFMRVIEGLTSPPRNNMKGGIASRLGPLVEGFAEKDYLDAYNVRSKIEHMESWTTGLPAAPVERQEEHAKRLYAGLECIACELLVRALHPERVGRFRDDAAITELWAAPPAEQLAFWGSPIVVTDAAVAE